MEKLIKRLKTLLRRNFKGAEVTLEQASPDSKVGGYLIWDGFQEMDQLERQHQMWEVFRAHLSPEERQKLTAILTLTPEEMAVAQED